MDFIKMY